MKRNALPAQRQPLSNEAINQMVALFNAANWPALEAAAREATRLHPQHLFGWKALGKALLMSNQLGDARSAFERVTKIAPADVDAHSDLGAIFHTQGLLGEAQASYGRALKANPRYPGAHCNLGMVLRDLGKLDEAEASYRRELALDPASAIAHNNLCALLIDGGRWDEARAAGIRAVELDPNFAQAYVNLGFVQCELDEVPAAEASYRRALALAPGFAAAHSRLGVLLGRDKLRAPDAMACLEQALALNPADADALQAMGNLLLDLGRIDESNALFRRAQQLQPLIEWKTLQARPDFSVLMLDAPGAGCTPLNYLAGKGSYDRYFLALLPDVEYDVEYLRSKADIVVNMIADADNGKEVLPRALALVDRLGLPTLNHPRLILGSDRESVAVKLAGIALCRSPRTVRLRGAQLAGPERGGHIGAFATPLLVRRAGTHGGDDFDKVDHADAVAPLVAGKPDEDFYISEYIDCQSPDGCYRKYRFICIDGQILPYHLAIHDHWMVHHFRTDMGDQVWKRAEEEAFLSHTERTFSAQHMAALAAIRDAVGLDYCGIDCSFDQAGNIVVFEANATMLVHDEKNEPFRYKNPYIARIKAAFDSALARLAKAA